MTLSNNKYLNSPFSFVSNYFKEFIDHSGCSFLRPSLNQTDLFLVLALLQAGLPHEFPGLLQTFSLAHPH